MTACTTQFKVKPYKIQAWREKEDVKSQSYPRTNWQVIASGEKRESVFFKSIATEKLTTLGRKATHPRIYGEHKLDLLGTGKERENKKL